jgi:ribosomal protein S27E
MIKFIQAANAGPKERERGVKVIDTRSSDEIRIKCPECGRREMHIYKQDASLYFCGNCAHTIPVVKVKRDTTVEPVDGDNSKNGQKTFIGYIPWRRNTDRGRRGMMEENISYLIMRKRGLQLTDYYEIGPD